MNNKELEQLFKLLADTDIYDFELDKPSCKLKIKRGAPAQIAPAFAVSHTAPAYRKEETYEPPKPAVEKTEPEAEKKNVQYIVSPMVGTFYRAPSADTKPYVEKGDMVAKGQVLCIIEAMKLFNEIESNISGKIVELLVENGSPVEYGEKLFAIEASK